MVAMMTHDDKREWRTLISLPLAIPLRLQSSRAKFLKSAMWECRNQIELGGQDIERLRCRTHPSAAIEVFVNSRERRRIVREQTEAR